MGLLTAVGSRHLRQREIQMATRMRFALAAVVVCSSFLGATAASAGVTSYPASMCMQIGPETKDMLSRYGDAEITTFYSPPLTVTCPTVQQGGNVLSASVTVRKFYSTGTISCRLTVRNDSGSVSYQSALASVTAVGTTPI